MCIAGNNNTRYILIKCRSQFCSKSIGRQSRLLSNAVVRHTCEIQITLEIHLSLVQSWEKGVHFRSKAYC